VFEFGRRPGGDAALVPLKQKRLSLVDRKVEALDKNASRVERTIMAALARDGRRDLRKIGCGPGETFVTRRGGCERRCTAISGRNWPRTLVGNRTSIRFA
jgi:hypothetical protein